MAISTKMLEFSQHSSWIRKMFEEGMRLKAQYGAKNVFDFSLGNPDLPPPKEFGQALKRLALEETPGMHGYMPNGGYPFVRAKVAETISSEQGVKLTGDDLLMTCGAAGALNVTLKSLLNPGEEVIILTPFFVEYTFYVDNHGGVPRMVPTDQNFNLDLDAIEAAINEKTKAIIINSPNNPTGQIYSAEALAGLAAVLTRAGEKLGASIYLLADEPYRKIVYNGCEVPGVMQYYRNSIVVSSYSKDLSLPGERIGFIAVHPDIEARKELINALTLANRILGFVNAPALMQRVVAEIQGAAVDCSVYARRREVFCRILADAGLEFMPPSGAFYIFPKSPIPDEVEFIGLLRDRKILAVPGRGFGAPGYFRLAFCVEDKVIERSAEGFRDAVAAARGNATS